jgi:hypothetical protein
MYVNPFWFGFVIGAIAMFIMLALAACLSDKEKK